MKQTLLQYISLSALSLGLVTASALQRRASVPSNVRAFYNRVRTSKCAGGEVLQDGFYSREGGSKSFAYCQDDKTGVVYIHGTGTRFTNMDVDCDGDLSDDADGRCGSSEDTQSETAFKDLVQQYSAAAGRKVSDVNANYVPYVVFGNDGSAPGYTNFDPEDYGIKPLSVMAVVCGSKLIYGVWADTNGDDGPPLVGEASISLATACYGTSINGNNGHDTDDVLYIAFPGTTSQTVQKNANWGAKSFDSFQNSIKSLGDKLVAKLS